MCLRRLRKPLVPQLKRQAAASRRKQQLRVRTLAALAFARASTTISPLVGVLVEQTKVLRRPP